MTRDEITQLSFLIFPGFPMACLTSMIEPLRAANEIAGKTAFGWKLVSEDGKRVEASAEVWFEPDMALAECEDIDHLILLSGPSSKFTQPQPSEGKLRKLARHGAVIGAVSGGVFPLARSGLLEGHAASVHWCYEAAFAAEFPEIEATEDVIAIGGRRMTASGAAAAFDLALHLVEASLGAGVATEVACWFQHPLVRGQGVIQLKPTVEAESTSDMLPDMVRQAVELFSENIEDPINIADVANIVGVSARQLERLFFKATGKTPFQYYRFLRMHKARQLLHYSKETLPQIALAVGCSTPSSMSRSYTEVFGISPAEDRKKVNMFRVRDNSIAPPA
ncbi:GlxA family transcriptional regulator [uncultured Sulfitobacter sp.]|uniref:GlxA family transcriptional regulator n=1 Tax=uncultured Sulfitobacter sp. TaxID=191468 RepID=UPI002601CEF1|nr:GlxA family transcriptional regulator [uncultured Sulfitobacter sp.]